MQQEIRTGLDKPVQGRPSLLVNFERHPRLTNSHFHYV